MRSIQFIASFPYSEKYPVFCFFCLWRVALYLKAMSNSIDFNKGIFLHVIPVRIVASCCDHTVNKRNQALNCYSFLELKQQNLKDAIYFLSLMLYSINKLKVYMLFISKNLLVSVFRFYVEKKFLLQKMVVVVVEGVELPPSTALHSPPPTSSV